MSGVYDSNGKYWPNKRIIEFRLSSIVPKNKIQYIPKVTYNTEYGYTTSRDPNFKISK